MALRKPLFMQTEGFSEEMDPTDTAAFGGLTLSGVINMQTNKITNLGDPTSPQDAATKFYVDAVATGLDWKQSVRLATAAALAAVTAAGTGVGKTLTANANGALSVDGVAVAVTNRILVKNQVAGADNGVYVVTDVGSAGTPFILTRATDADTGTELNAGAAMFVEEGTANSDTGWVLTTNDPVTVDTTSLVFAQFSSATALTFDQGLLKTGASITIELDTAAGTQTAGAGGGSSGLEFDVNTAAGKLRAAVNGTGGLQRSATGLSLLLADTTLSTSASGVQVDYAPRVQEPRAVVEAIAVADAVYQSTTSNQVGKARADTNAKSNVIGVAKTAQPTPGSNADIVYSGQAAGVLAGATPGDQYYLQATGGIGTAVPGAGNRVISVGFAQTATVLFTRVVDYGKKAA